MQVEKSFDESRSLVSDLFRAVNDRIRELNEAAVGECEFVCECGDEACMHVLHMTVAEYDAARSDRAQFALLPGHQRPTSQNIVSRSERFVLVKDR
jgi:hypothetical protein